MPRPFAVIGISFYITLVFLSDLNEKAAIAFLMISTVCLGITVSVKTFRQQAVFPAACLAVAAGCVLFIASNEYIYKPAVAFKGENVRFSGKIIDLPELNNGRFYYIIKTDKINGKQATVKLRLSCAKPLDAQPFDTAETVATVYVLGENNEDSLKYYKTTGIYLGAYSFSDIKISHATTRPVLYYVLEIKQRIYNNITNLLPNESGGLVIALLLGDKSLLSESTVANFLNIGISHIIAISGLNLSIFLMIFLDVFDRLRFNRRIASAVSVFFVLLVMALAGFSASVSRAGIMMLVLLTGKILNRDADSLNSIGLSVLVLSFINPLGAGYIGLQLSFFATLGIIILNKRIMIPAEKLANKIHNKIPRRFVKFICETAAVTVTAFIFTLPTLILTFERIALVSIISNIILVYSSTLSMIFGGLSALFAEFPFISFLCNPLAIISGISANYILKCSELLANFRFSSISVSDDYFKLWLSGAFIILAFSVLFTKSNKKNYYLAAILCVFSLSTGVVSEFLLNRNVTKITVADVGNGSAILISNNGKSAMIGCGGDDYSVNSIISALQNDNIHSLDYMLIPGVKDTESHNANNILRVYKTKAILSPEINNNLEFLTGSKKLLLSKREKIELWKDTEISFIYSSAVSCTYADIKGTKVLFLFSPGCNISDIPAGWLKADIVICRLKAPKWVDFSDFGTVVISADNTMGPLEAELINKTGGNAYTTAQLGNIIIKSSGNSEYSIGREN